MEVCVCGGVCVWRCVCVEVCLCGGVFVWRCEYGGVCVEVCVGADLPAFNLDPHESIRLLSCTHIPHTHPLHI